MDLIIFIFSIFTELQLTVFDDVALMLNKIIVVIMYYMPILWLLVLYNHEYIIIFYIHLYNKYLHPDFIIQFVSF